MKNNCSSCENQKVTLECELCQSPLCKNCSQFVEENFFSFLEKIPVELQKTTFCPSCYANQILPEIETYNRDLERAKDILVFEKTQGKETRFIRRTEKPLKVSDCADREEVMLRLAFQSLRRGFNGILDFEATSEKEKNRSYNKVSWKGSAIPANIESNKLMKDKALRDNPN